MLRGVIGGAGVRAELRRIGSVTVASLAGQMNESFDGGELARRLSSHRGTVVLDLAQVSRISSFGVREWLEMVRGLSVDRLVLARCSEAVINQISMVRSFKGGGEIASFLAPYVCSACGTEFSALYDVANDRALLERGETVPVPCPRCGAPGAFDDDPDLYFDLEQHLIEHVDDDLEEVLDDLPGLGAEGDPIQKTVEGRDTWITFNTRIDERLRLHRVLEGLEGQIVFDLTPAMAITPEGVQRFVQGVQTLGPEVTRVRLVGIVPEVVRALVDAPNLDPRVRISSVRVDAKCSNPETVRKITVNLAAPAIADGLRQGLPPSIPCDWCSGPLDYGNALTLLQRAAELAPEPIDLTPMGAARRAAQETIPLPSRHSATPALGSGGAVPMVTPAGAPQGRFGSQSADAETRVLDRGGSEAGDDPRVTTLPTTWLALGAVLLGGMIGAGGLVGGVLLAVTLRGEPQPSGPAPVPAAATITDPAGATWEGGEAPGWVSHVWAEGPEQVEIVGTASAETPEEGLKRARAHMMRTLLSRLHESLRGEAAFPYIERSANDLSDEQLDAAVEAYTERVGLFATPERVDHAIRNDPDGTFVAARYTVGREDWRRAREVFARTHSFKGMTVGTVFPTMAAELTQSGDLVVVDSAIWLRAVEEGDVILEVGGTRVSTLDDYTDVLTRTWRATPRGDWMSIRVLRDGEPRTVEFRR